MSEYAECDEDGYVVSFEMNDYKLVDFLNKYGFVVVRNITIKMIF